MKSLTDCHRRLAYLSGVILLALTVLPLCAAEHSPTLDYVLANTPSDEPVSVLLFLDHRLTMDDVYSAARNLPMQERRQYVVNVLQRRFSEMSPGVMEDLELAAKSGTVTLLRPLWILNAIRVSAIPEVIRDVDRNHSEVIYIATDAVYEDALDWGVAEIGAPQVWEEYGADGSGVVVGHKDAGLDWDHPGFDGHIWVNPGEDLNHNGHIDEPDEVNNIDDDSNGYVDDFRGWNFDYHNNDVSDDPQGGGHGTKTGSVISASNSTVCGQISVAPGAKLMVLRGVWTQGAFYEASQYAIAMNANVISSSASYKLSTCDYVLYRDCPNFVAHRWVCEMELAAGIIHANSVGNEGLANPVPLSVAAPANCPPPAMTAGHEQQGGVSSVVGVAAYFQNGSYYSSSGHGPSGWSEEDICAHPRMPYCGPDGSSSEYPAEFEDYPYHDSEFPGLAKPDITAPTIVPSLDRGGGCDNINATSGAAPHVGGALALIYSAFPGITPEDAYFVLMNGVVDAGEAGYDSLWGFGKLRIFRACSLAVDLRAIVAGHVEDPLDNPVTDVRVSAEGTSVALTDEGGDYAISLEEGTHVLTFEKWGYQDTSHVITTAPGETYVQDAFLWPAVAASVNGTATYEGVPMAGVDVSLPEGNVTVTTNEAGQYAMFDLFAGTYDFVVGNLPWETQTVSVTLAPGETIVPFAVERSPRARRSGPDNYGYYIYDRYDSDLIAYDWIEINPNQGGAGINLNLSGDNCTVRTLPFPVQFYGQEYTDITICTNGFVTFGAAASDERWPYPIPRLEEPNGFVAPFYVDWATQGGGVYLLADAANHRVIIEWWNVRELYDVAQATFQVILYERGFPVTPTMDSQVIFQYAAVQGRFEGLVGMENQGGTDGIQFEFQTTYDLHAAPIEAEQVLWVTTDALAASDPTVELPTEYSLGANYPNPFNPTTTLVWNMPRAAHVRLTLFDVLGRESAVAFEGMAEAGRHELLFNAAELPTGLYFTRLEVNGQMLAARKLLLLK